MVRSGEVYFPERHRVKAGFRFTISLRRTAIGTVRSGLRRWVGSLRVAQIPHRRGEGCKIVDLIRHRAGRLVVHFIAFLVLVHDGTILRILRQQLEVG